MFSPFISLVKGLSVVDIAYVWLWLQCAFFIFSVLSILHFSLIICKDYILTYLEFSNVSFCNIFLVVVLNTKHMYIIIIIYWHKHFIWKCLDTYIYMYSERSSQAIQKGALLPLYKLLLSDINNFLKVEWEAMIDLIFFSLFS